MTVKIHACFVETKLFEARLITLVHSPPARSDLEVQNFQSKGGRVGAGPMVRTCVVPGNSHAHPHWARSATQCNIGVC